MENRILKGFNYFWNRKPSEWRKIDTVWLHEWMKLLKNEAAKKKETIEEFAERLFGG